MIKSEMIKLLKEEYGYNDEDLKNEKGNPLRNDELEKLIEKEQVKNSENDEKEQNSSEEDDFGVDETIFESRHQLNDKDLILCMSGVSGDMNFVSALSNFRTKTTGFGQTMKIPYGDLAYVHNIAPDAFESGRIIVLNTAVQEEFGLKDLYKKVLTPKNIRKVLNMNGDELKEFISDMPRAMKSALYDEARKSYNTGKIDSIKTVEVIEKEFGVSLKDNAPVEDVVKK